MDTTKILMSLAFVLFVSTGSVFAADRKAAQDPSQAVSLFVNRQVPPSQNKDIKIVLKGDTVIILSGIEGSLVIEDEKSQKEEKIKVGLNTFDITGAVELKALDDKRNIVEKISLEK